MTDENMTLEQAIAQLENPHQHELVLNHGELTQWLKELQERRNADTAESDDMSEAEFQPLYDEISKTVKKSIDFDLVIFEHLYQYQPTKQWVDEAIRNALDSLTNREHYVVTERIYYNRTLDSLAQDFDLSRERIRQIENKAYMKMSKYISQLDDVDRFSPRAEIVYVPNEKSGSIADMGFSVRLYNALNRADIHTLDDLLNACVTMRIRRIRNLGNKSLNELREALTACGVDAKYLQWTNKYPD